MENIKLSTLKTLARKVFLAEALQNKKVVTWVSQDDEESYKVFIALDNGLSLYAHFPRIEIVDVIEEFAFDRNANKCEHFTEENTMEHLAAKKSDAKKPKPAPRKPCKNDVKKYTPSLNGKGENLNVVV